MKHLVQKQERFWWTKKSSYILYFIREFSGILIAAYVLTSIIIEAGIGLAPGGSDFAHSAVSFKLSITFLIIQYAGLTGALIHSITWLIIMPTISPIELSRKQQAFGAVILFALAIFFSYILSITFHTA
jgi:fumarate reductase subunit C